VHSLARVHDPCHVSTLVTRRYIAQDSSRCFKNVLVNAIEVRVL